MRRQLFGMHRLRQLLRILLWKHFNKGASLCVALELETKFLHEEAEQTLTERMGYQELHDLSTTRRTHHPFTPVDRQYSLIHDADLLLTVCPADLTASEASSLRRATRC
mmetsp:Transcript_32108/g.48438  ORF Transcript_32108/g.48438 Transcript_32108/m.48438 type:complete len:109 (-) Transcript_32108:12-338(-)